MTLFSLKVIAFESHPWRITDADRMPRRMMMIPFQKQNSSRQILPTQAFAMAPDTTRQYSGSLNDALTTIQCQMEVTLACSLEGMGEP
jgi:hypothetical protein